MLQNNLVFKRNPTSSVISKSHTCTWARWCKCSRWWLIEKETHKILMSVFNPRALQEYEECPLTSREAFQHLIINGSAVWRDVAIAFPYFDSYSEILHHRNTTGGKVKCSCTISFWRARSPGSPVLQIWMKSACWEMAVRDLSPFPYSAHSLPLQDTWWIMWLPTPQSYMTFGKTEILPSQSSSTGIIFSEMYLGKTEITNRQICK